MENGVRCKRCFWLNEYGGCEKTHYFPDREGLHFCASYRAITKYDHINAMPVKKFAEFMGMHVADEINKVLAGGQAKSILDWYEWLNEPLDQETAL